MSKIKQKKIACKQRIKSLKPKRTLQNVKKKRRNLSARSVMNMKHSSKLN